MAKTDNDFRVFEAPFGGVDESMGRRRLSPTALYDCRNVVIREDRIAPRPGGVIVQNEPFKNVLEVVNASLRNMGGIAFDPGSRTLYRTNRYGTNKRVQSIDVDSAAASTTVVSGLTDPQAIALHRSAGHLYYVEHPQIRRVAVAGTGDVQLIANAANGAPGPLSGLALAPTQATPYMLWCTGQHVMKATLAGASSTAIVSTGAPTSVTVRDTATPLVLWIDQSGSQQTIKRADLTGAGNTTIYTAASGRTLSGLVHDGSQPGRVFFTESGGGFAGVLTCLDDGTNLETLLSNTLVLPRHIAYDGDTDELYLTDLSGGFERLFRLNAAPDLTVSIVNAFPIRRSMLGVEGSPPFEDMTLLQLRNESLARSDYALRFPALGTAFLLRQGFARGGDGVPDLLVTNSRNARATPGAPFSPTAGKACIAWTGRGIDDGGGGALIADGGVDECLLDDTGTPPTVPPPLYPAQNEIQRIDLGVQADGYFKLKADSGLTDVSDADDANSPYETTGSTYKDFDPATLKTALCAILDCDEADLILTAVDIGGGLANWPIDLEFTLGRGNQPMPLIEPVDDGLTTPANIKVTERIQVGREAPGSPPVIEEHQILNVARSQTDPGAATFVLRMYTEAGVQYSGPLYGNASREALLAALAFIQLEPGVYVEVSNLEVETDVVDLGGTSWLWSCKIRWAKDYAGRRFNVPQRVNSEDLP